MLRLLGRQTSGNVQKVIFMLEELGLPYVREDYGRQFNNTQTDAYRRLNPNAKVPTLVDGERRDLGIAHYFALPGRDPRAAAHRRKPGGSHPGRALDGLAAGRAQRSFPRVFREASKPASERHPDFATQAADLVAQLKIADGHLAGRQWFALDRLTIADIALAPITKRCLAFPIEKPALENLSRWQGVVEARPAFAVAVGAKPSRLTSAA